MEGPKRVVEGFAVAAANYAGQKMHHARLSARQCSAERIMCDSRVNSGALWLSTLSDVPASHFKHSFNEHQLSYTS
jgi:hypothetical protein